MLQNMLYGVFYNTFYIGDALVTFFTWTVKYTRAACKGIVMQQNMLNVYLFVAKKSRSSSR